MGAEKSSSEGEPGTGSWAGLENQWSVIRQRFNSVSFLHGEYGSWRPKQFAKLSVVTGARVRSAHSPQLAPALGRAAPLVRVLCWIDTSRELYPPNPSRASAREGFLHLVINSSGPWSCGYFNACLAFDHATILQVALDRLRAKVRYQPIGFELLPKAFTLTELQCMYETTLGRLLDKRNFRKRVLQLGILKPTGRKTAGPARPAELYRFDRRGYQSRVKSGFVFDL